jgi:hypothetical protein
MYLLKPNMHLSTCNCGGGGGALRIRRAPCVFHLNSLTAQLSYEGRAAVEGWQVVLLNLTTII